MNRSWDIVRAKAHAKLDRLAQKNRNRSLPAEICLHKAKIDLSTNDYLNLNSDKTWQSYLRNTIGHRSLGSGSSRLLGQDQTDWVEVEKKFATFKGADSALYFTSGYAANESLIYVLSSLGYPFFSDEMNHASIIDGLKNSLLPKSRIHRYKHNNYEDLEEKLKDYLGPKFIITEAIFSMDGTITNLVSLSDIAHRHDAILIIDEAHSLGCLGRNGKGLLEYQGLPHEKVISINPCGKGFGAQGAFVSGPSWLRNLLINSARRFIYSTAPSPWIAGAIAAAIDKMPSLHDRRMRLHRNSSLIRKDLQRRGFALDPNGSHIVPIIIGDESEVIRVSKYLESLSIRVGAIRPPTVTAGTSRLRLCIHQGLDKSDILNITSQLEAIL